jgi:hypothetical protein
MGMTFFNCGLVLLGYFVGSSRIRNNKHYWIHVSVGALFGLSMAIVGILADRPLMDELTGKAAVVPRRKSEPQKVEMYASVDQDAVTTA